MSSALNPDAVAVVCNGQPLTFRDLGLDAYLIRLSTAKEYHMHDWQAGDVIATTEETWGLEIGTEGVITKVIATDTGPLLTVDFEDAGSRLIAPRVARFVERPPDLRDAWDGDAYLARLLVAAREPLVHVTVRVKAEDPGAA